jgi:hypothetical protein
MRLRTLSALVISGVLLSLVFSPQRLAEPPKSAPPAPPVADVYTIIMHFKGEKLTTADPAAGNATEEKATAAGRPWGARFSGTVIGEWAFLPKGDFEIQGAFKAELWGQSTQGAKNAGFRLNFYVGNTMWDMYTDRADVSSPHKFTVASSVTTNVRAGVTVKVGLVWLSDPNYFIGPSSGGDFLYGSMDHDSKVSFTLSKAPVTMNMTGYEREKDAMKLNCKVNDSLGMDPNDLGYELMMTGPATILPEYISKPMVAAGDNGTMVSWRWNTKLSKAQSGTYTLTITVAYCNDTRISNSTQMDIKMPVEVKVDALKALTTGTNLVFLVITIVIVAAVAGSATLVALRRRKRRRARLRAERELAMAAEAA